MTNQAFPGRASSGWACGSSAARAKGRRALFFGFAFFALSQLALASALALGTVRLPPANPAYQTKSAKMKQRLAEASSREPAQLLVFLGSSRVLGAIHEGRMSRRLSDRLSRPVTVGSLAVPGGSSRRSALQYDRLRRDGLRPTFVLIEILPAMLDSVEPYDDCAADQLPPAELDAADRDFLRRDGLARPDLDGWPEPDALIPFSHHRQRLLSALAPGALPPVPPSHALDPEAGGCRPPVDCLPKLRAEAHNRYYKVLQHLAPGGPAADSLSRLLARLRQEGVRAALFTMPEGPRFRSWYPRDRWEHSRTWLADFARREGVPLFDLREWTDCEEDFFDSHHLWETGSVRFSDHLADKVIPRWVGREVAGAL